MRAYDWKKGRGGRGNLRGLDAVTRKDVDFFKANAGYIVGEKAQGALALAKAEEAADRLGWTVAWEPDDLPWDGDDGYEPNEVLCAVLKDARGKVRASLCGIADPDTKYARVIEAELAAEALGKTGRGWAKKRVKLARRRDGSMMGGAGDFFDRHNNKAAVVAVALIGWLVYKKIRG